MTGGPLSEAIATKVLLRQPVGGSYKSLSCTSPNTFHLQRERERETDRQTETDRETERQRDRETDRETDRQRETETERERQRTCSTTPVLD